MSDAMSTLVKLTGLTGLCVINSFHLVSADSFCILVCFYECWLLHLAPYVFQAVYFFTYSWLNNNILGGIIPASTSSLVKLTNLCVPTSFFNRCWPSLDEYWSASLTTYFPCKSDSISESYSAISSKAPFQFRSQCWLILWSCMPSLLFYLVGAEYFNAFSILFHRVLNDNQLQGTIPVQFSALTDLQLLCAPQLALLLLLLSVDPGISAFQFWWVLASMPPDTWIQWWFRCYFRHLEGNQLQGSIPKVFSALAKLSSLCALTSY